MTSVGRLKKLCSVLFCAAASIGLASALAQSGVRQQALALEQQGRNAEAAEIWSSIVEHDPHDAEALAHLGLIEARQEHYGQAIAYYRRAVALDPAFPSLEMNLGLALFKTDQFGDAMAAFTAELEKHPSDLRLITLLGMSHYAMGDYLVAIPYLEKATEADARNENLRMTLARSCLWSRQYGCVVKSTEEILALDPGSADAAVLAGEALAAQGKTAAAMEQFRAAIRANDKEPDAHFGLGYLLWEQGRYAEAAAEFKAELEIDSSEEETRASFDAAASNKKPDRPLIEAVPNAQPPGHP